MRAPIVFRGLLLLLAMFELLLLVLALPQLGALDTTIPHAAVLGMAIAVCVLLLVPLIGLWFYQRWARMAFLVILVIAVLDSFHRSRLHLSVHLPFFFGAIRFLQHGFYGAVTAMMFLPPTSELFSRRSNQSLEPMSDPR
ncbi:MAG TPA: hypothetical protein VJ281_05895 [Chthoniobacterales bacterium]|jgi:hypothetical protein|nr:hypothetical protein [Chthoniobacterales bacterium]